MILMMLMMLMTQHHQRRNIIDPIPESEYVMVIIYNPNGFTIKPPTAATG
jgi:hypothetical protein